MFVSNGKEAYFFWSQQVAHDKKVNDQLKIHFRNRRQRDQ